VLISGINGAACFSGASAVISEGKRKAFDDEKIIQYTINIVLGYLSVSYCGAGSG